ncbi:MAG: M23 family metallopeptidase [Bacteroidales bacterium]|nr:M23 family metallopeptidase [Bacteroidales bacterium]
MNRRLRYILYVLALTVVFYAAGSFLFSGGYESLLARGNRAHNKLYPEILEREQLIRDAVASLQYRDDNLYRDIFGTEAPDLGALEIPSGTSLDQAEADAAAVEDNFSEIFRTLAAGEEPVPPMCFPVRDISYAQAGASVGEKYNLVYKMNMRHDGMDFIVPLGSDVLASADGVVIRVGHSERVQGKFIEIIHNGRYVSRYVYVSDIKVHKGTLVKAGDRIASVGMAGAAFIPHLHYELERDGVILDPMDHCFASVVPTEYAYFLYMAENTEQSMN